MHPPIPFQKHGYAPNFPQPAYRNLALVVPYDAVAKGGSGYLTNLIVYVSLFAEELGMNTCLLFQRLDERGTLLGKLRAQQATGALFVLGGLLRNQMAELARSGLPLICIDERFDLDSVGYVDNRANEGIEAAIEHLVGLGHRCISFLYNRPELSNHADRRDLYAASMVKHGLMPAVEAFAPEGGL